MDEAIAVSRELSYSLRTPIPVPPVVYIGPGDVISGAFAFWGLRAYDNASIGGNAVRLRRDSDNAEQDFATIAGGGLDNAAIATFKGAANLRIVTLYDQTGNAIDQTQAAAANQPAYIPNGIGSLPIMTFVNANAYYLFDILASGLAQPFSFVAVFRYTTFNGGRILTNQNNDVELFSIGGGTISIYAGSQIDLTAATATWYAGEGVFNSAASAVYANGLSATGSAGTGILNSGSYLTVGGFTGSTAPLDGDIAEVGIWPIALSAGQAASLQSNQSAYWGL